MKLAARYLAMNIIALLGVFLVHRYLMFWQQWPDFSDSLSVLSTRTDTASNLKSFLVIGAYLLMPILIAGYLFKHQTQTLSHDAILYSRWSSAIIRFAFWSVFLIGVVDTIISALRIENVLPLIIGENLDSKLGLAKFRGLYVHYPLLILAAIIAFFTQGLSFIWLALLVVFSEFSIVITRFVFSYEQAYMGDLVRFWYAALFLFASSYTLVEEGHVRVDVIYANLSKRAQARVNVFGCLLLGIPFCLTIIILGLESKFSSLASPIINFEISQSSYGLFVKYLMAGFLLIFALSMLIQFVSYFLRSCAILLNEPLPPANEITGAPT